MAWNDIPDWSTAVADSLLATIRERDPYTYGHCRRVASLARNLAAAAGLNEYEQKVIEMASLFHDLGKIGIPDSVLNKQGKLTNEEFDLIKQHPIQSANILAPFADVSGFFESVLPGVRSHHERIDGTGYPDGRLEEDIPLSARILVIADTFDAMTSDRPYRKKLPDEIAYKELKLFSGRQFDSQLAKIFVQAHPTWRDDETLIAGEIVMDQIRRTA